MEHGKGTPTFEAIYEAYAERVLNLAYRMTGDEETARDLTQEIFIKVYEHLGSFEHRSRVFTWLYRIAVNHVANHLKKERRRRWVSIMDWRISDVFREEEAASNVNVAAIEDPADKKLESEERARVVWSAVQTLPPKYRVPLVLWYYDGLSYQEIADTLAISLSAVETRIHRAKKRLAKGLEPWLERI